MALNPHAVIRGGLPESSMTIKERVFLDLLVASIIGRPLQPLPDRVAAAMLGTEAYLNEVAP